MVDYTLKILRNGEPVESLEAAIYVLDNYTGHYVGQPIAIVYLNEESERHLLLALGKRDCENEPIPVPGGYRNYGPEFYEIINDISEGSVFEYISSYPGTAQIVADVGGIHAGMTLMSLMNETNGDISKILDLIFFGETSSRPTIIQPYIVDFSVSDNPDHAGLKDVVGRTAPIFTSLHIKTNRGLVSYGERNGEIVHDVEYAGPIDSAHVRIISENGDTLGYLYLKEENEIFVLDDSMDNFDPLSLREGNYIYRLEVTFADGDVTPLNSDGTVFDSPYEGGEVHVSDIVVHVTIGWICLRDEQGDDSDNIGIDLTDEGLAHFKQSINDKFQMTDSEEEEIYSHHVCPDTHTE